MSYLWTTSIFEPVGKISPLGVHFFCQMSTEPTTWPADLQPLDVVQAVTSHQVPQSYSYRRAFQLRLVAHQVQRVGCLHWWRATKRRDSTIHVRGWGAQSQEPVVL